MTRPTGSDSAGLAYDALEKARAEGADILLIDTAGRLHNKADLMGELQKIVRVLKKLDPEAPHSVLLVLDATVGQNAHAQAETFRDMIGVTGIVMTKLDGTAKGGVLVSLAEKYGIPIHAIGIGETAEDLRPFDARAYARSLVGLDAVKPLRLGRIRREAAAAARYGRRNRRSPAPRARGASAQRTDGKASSSHGISSQPNRPTSRLSGPGATAVVDAGGRGRSAAPG